MRLLLPAAVLLLPYLPIGLIFLLLRLFIYPHAMIASLVLSSCGLVKRSVLRVMCLVLGFAIRSKHCKRIPERQKSLPIISNHVTLFDHLMLCLTQECVTPHAHVFHWNATYVPLETESISELVGRCVQEDLCSVQLFPEKRPVEVSGRMLDFDTNYFDALDKVQPVAINVVRPFPVKLVEYPINWVGELLWHLFVPFTVYNIDYLDPMSRQPDESSEEFANRVRQTISRALNPSSSKKEDEEDLLPDQPYVGQEPACSSSDPSSPSLSPKSSISTIRSSILSISSSFTEDCEGLRYRGAQSEPVSPAEATTPVPFPPVSEEGFPGGRYKLFDHLIPQVREVLCDLPVSRIRDALVSADGDVDAAIDSLISKEDDDSNASSESTLLPVGRLRMAADTFHTTSQGRQQSLLERRKAMLAHARQRFSGLATDD